MAKDPPEEDRQMKDLFRSPKDKTKEEPGAPPPAADTKEPVVPPKEALPQSAAVEEELEPMPVAGCSLKKHALIFIVGMIAGVICFMMFLSPIGYGIKKNSADVIPAPSPAVSTDAERAKRILGVQGPGKSQPASTTIPNPAAPADEETATSQSSETPYKISGSFLPKLDGANVIFSLSESDTLVVRKDTQYVIASAGNNAVNGVVVFCATGKAYGNIVPAQWPNVVNIITSRDTAFCKSATYLYLTSVEDITGLEGYLKYALKGK